MEEEEKEKRKKAILIIILILLLLLIFFFIFKYIWKMAETSNPYVNITNNIGNSVQDGEGINNNIQNSTTPETTQNTVNPQNSNNSTDNNTNNNNTNNNDTNNNTNNNTTGGGTTNPPEEVKEFEIESEDFKWGSTNNLKVFDNITLNHSTGVIWPGAMGNYDFNVSNTLDQNVIYKISFKDQNEGKINLKYKIKKNDEYIINDWSYAEEINLEEVTLYSNQKDKYILEWQWIEQTEEQDMLSMGKPYNLSIQIYMER